MNGTWNDEDFTHRHVTSGEVTLHVVEGGKGKGRPLVVFLHGFPEFWWSWRHQMRALVDAGFHVVAPDMRGFNESDAPKSVAAYGMDTLLDDVSAVIRSTGAKKAMIVGHDWGGHVAWNFAMHRPDEVTRLAVLNCAHPVAMMKGLRTLKQLRRSWYMFLFQLPKVPEALFRFRGYEGVRRAFETLPREETTPYVDAARRAGGMRGGLAYYRAAFRDVARFRTRKPRPIDVDVLVVWGRHDRFLGPEIAEPPRRFVPNLRMEWLDDAGHWVQHDARDAVNAHLVSFAKGIHRQSRGVHP
ncbi:MAG: alpha/beta fold hydrolase [Polyangiaceae bacterium]